MSEHEHGQEEGNPEDAPAGTHQPGFEETPGQATEHNAGLDADLDGETVEADPGASGTDPEPPDADDVEEVRSPPTRAEREAEGAQRLRESRREPEE